MLDFRTPESFAEPATYQRGWWFGARTIRENKRAGSMMADVLAVALTELSYLKVYPRAELQALISEQHMSSVSRLWGPRDPDLSKIILEVPPLDIGRDVQADQVLTGEILEAYESSQNTLQTWNSFVRVRIDLWDMAEGKVVWTRSYTCKRRYYSVYKTMEKMSGKIANDLEEKWYRRPASERQAQQKPLD